MKTEDAINHLTSAWKQNDDYRESWKANIAMAYKDNYHWYKQKTGKTVMNHEDLHIIANNAADYFLEQLSNPPTK